MTIKGLEISNDGIVHENEDRMVFGVFNYNNSNKDGFLAKNCRVFIVKKDAMIGDHYREDEETYAVLAGEGYWFFEDIKTNEKESHLVQVGGKVKIPPMIAHVVKAKKESIILGRYKKSFEKMKTHKHILE